VFADPAALAKLNAITHPAILARVGRELATAHREGLPWVVYEAALILENKLAPGLSRLVVVLADPEVQVQRLMARSGLPETEARQRIAAQTDNATRRAAADHVIENHGDLAALEARADAVFDALSAAYGALTA
ncbi:MAG: dephospho-CoA kinase, partial [Myxococcales bacterium]|nr:dephospho-CoA kinase [Myxococcales bacterium]